MVKKSSKNKIPVKKIELCSLHKMYSNVSWTKIGITLIVGGLMGSYFGNSNLDMHTIILFIAIVLIALCLTLLLDIRRHVIVL